MSTQPINTPSGDEQHDPETHDPKTLAAVVEWKKKYQVQENDPMFAALELFQIYFGHIHATTKGEASRIPSFVEFRNTVERLDGCSNRFLKQAIELIDTMRGVPDIRQQIEIYHAVLIALVALLCMGSGIFIGMLIL